MRQIPFLLYCQYFIHFLLFDFQEAQNQDPAYLQGWIGQALLAESASYEDEAIDLFRHCTFLGMKIWVVKFPWDKFLTKINIHKGIICFLVITHPSVLD